MVCAIKYSRPLKALVNQPLSAHYSFPHHISSSQSVNNHFAHFYRQNLISDILILTKSIASYLENRCVYGEFVPESTHLYQQVPMCTKLFSCYQKYIWSLTIFYSCEPESTHVTRKYIYVSELDVY